MSSAPAVPSEQPAEKRQRKSGLILLAIAILGGVFTLYWLIDARTRISTDNAFIQASVHPVSSRVRGTVLAVHVTDNQPVKKGDVLVELDTSDYQVGVSRSEAELALARSESSAEQIQVRASQALLDTAEAQLLQASHDVTRGRTLYNKDVIPKEALEKLETSYTVAKARANQAREQVKRDQAIAGAQSTKALHAARVQRQQAILTEQRLKLGYTRIIAPSDGYVTRKNVEVGMTLEAGQPILAIVPTDDVWITANLKESQLTHIKTGQAVNIKIDAYPGMTITGTVDSIMAGTGSAFSLLPPENATGNYVKVVQRVPVKIILSKESRSDSRLRVGMSVVPTIYTGRSFTDSLRSLF